MTTTHRIAEVARRSGFSPPTLRYYETIGLLPPAERSENGYRVYDELTLDRLAFIARAKQLGCSLDEIAELTTAWDGGRCAPVKARLASVIDAKVADAERRIGDLNALVTDLQRAATALAADTPDGPCDDHCGCTTTPTVEVDTDASAPVAFTTKPTSVLADDAPIACTLGTDEIAQRVDDWRTLLTHATDRAPIDDGLRLSFDQKTVTAEALGRLTAAEWDCCRFFAFTITVDARGLALEVRAPEKAQDVLTGLFGSAG